MIYVHQANKDIWVSKSVIERGNWHAGLVKRMYLFLLEEPNTAFLDLGANIGVFTLAVARMGRKVVAVEAFQRNVDLLCASVSANGFGKSVSIVYNAITNKRELVELHFMKGNVGGTYVKSVSKHQIPDTSVQSILFDDLLELFNFTRVAIKMGIQQS